MKFLDNNVTVQVNTIKSPHGTLINYVETVDDDTTKPLVIFVHGSPGSSDNFMNNMLDSNLLSTFKMISIDRLGFGYSSFGKSETSLDSQAVVIEPFLLKYQNRSIILVGHSYGGPFVVKAAVNHSKELKGIIVVSGSVSAELEPVSWWRKPADFLLFRWMLPRSLNASNQEIMALKTELKNMESEWARITTNVYLLHGETDDLVPIANVDFAATMLTNAKSVLVKRIPETNHFIPFQNDELIKKALFYMVNL